VVVWRRHISSLPLATGLPPLERKYVAFALSVPFGHSGRKPFINGSKGEEQPAAVAAAREEQKNTNILVCVFFIFKSASMPPRRQTTTSGSYLAHPSFRYFHES